MFEFERKETVEFEAQKVRLSFVKRTGKFRILKPEALFRFSGHAPTVFLRTFTFQ